MFIKNMFFLNQSSPEGAKYTSPGRKPWVDSRPRSISPVRAKYKSNDPIIIKNLAFVDNRIMELNFFGNKYGFFSNHYNMRTPINS